MKRVIPFALVACLGLALTAAAQTPPQYSQFRQDEPLIDEAVAAMDNSDMHGTLNRLSALYLRSGIEELLAGDGLDGNTPPNFDRNLAATLADLAEDVGKYEVESLTLQQKMTLLELVQIYGFERSMELWQGATFTRCPGACPIGEVCPPSSSCTDDDTDVENELDALASAAQYLYDAVRAAAPDQSGLVTRANLHAENFLANVNLACSRVDALIVNGAESIDD